MQVKPKVIYAVLLALLAMAAAMSVTYAYRRHENRQQTGRELLQAARIGNLATVKKLCTPDNINFRDPKDMTPIMLAIEKDHLEVVKFLFENGADMTLQERRYPYGATPFILAALWGQQDIVDYFLAHGVDINQRDKRRSAALYYAAMMKHYELVQFLIDHGADVNSQHILGETILSWAASCGDMQLLDICLKNKANLNLDTPLATAAICKKKDMVQALLNAGADPNIVRGDNKTALDFAVDNADKEMVSLLLKHGAQSARKLAPRR